MSTRRSIEKHRMRFTYEFVKEKISGKENAKKFESYVQKVPAFIMINGLGNTLAYLSTQTDKQWKNVQEAICNWLKAVENPLKEKLETSRGGIEDVLEVLKGEDFSNKEYRAITVEILAMFNWLRRFAKAHRQNLEAPKQRQNG